MFGERSCTESIRITGETIGITEELADAMQVSWRIVEPSIPRLLDRFYALPQFQPLFAEMSAERVARLKQLQENHWRSLFLSRFGDDCEGEIRRVAIAHKRAGLPQHVYMTAYYVMADLIERELRTVFPIPCHTSRLVYSALHRYVALDVILTARIYAAIEIDV